MDGQPDDRAVHGGVTMVAQAQARIASSRCGAASKLRVELTPVSDLSHTGLVSWICSKSRIISPAQSGPLTVRSTTLRLCRRRTGAPPGLGLGSLGLTLSTCVRYASSFPVLMGSGSVVHI